MDLLDSALSSNNQLDYDLFKARIFVCGVGGAGSNAVQRISKLGVKGATLVAANTDGKHLNTLDPTVKRVLLGGALTRGLGAGGFPEMGAKAAEYSRADIERALDGCNLLFMAAGMGGGTGTGAAPIVADVAKKMGSIVIGFVTFPFSLERIRLNVARKGIEELSKVVDTLIVIDNQRLVDVYPNLQIEQAFKVADEITSRAVQGITETISVPSLINIDFADIRAVMSKGGLAMISVGEGSGDDKVNAVVASTLKNKLLDVDFEGTTSVLLHIRGGDDLTLGEANEIANKLTEKAAPNANVIWGARLDPAYNGRVEVIAIFTGVKSPNILGASAYKKDESGELGIGGMQF